MRNYKEIRDDFGEAFEEVFDPKKTREEKLRSLKKWAYRLRTVLYTIPVVLFSAFFALRNLAVLPARVGFDLQASGDFAYTMDKSLAVFGPLVITGICLILMYCSKRKTYPWLVAMFSLAIPIVIYVTNTFTG